MAMAGELLDGVRAAKAAGGIDAVYFSMHGAMATFEEHDPEGWLLEQASRTRRWPQAVMSFAWPRPCFNWRITSGIYRGT